MQLIDAIPEKWKVIVRNHPNNSKGLVSKYSIGKLNLNCVSLTYLANLCMVNF